MLDQMTKEWYEQLDKWVTSLQEGKSNEVIEEMHDLVCGYEQGADEIVNEHDELKQLRSIR